MIAYLLHTLPEEERVAFAERWAAEPELYEELRMAEAELLDAYVRNELSAEQRMQVETCLLNSPRQLGKLAAAEQMMAGLSTPVRRRFSWFMAAAAAAILALAVAALALLRQNSGLRKEIAQLQQDARPAPGNLYSVFLPAGAVRGAPLETPVRVPLQATVVRLELELEPGDETSSYAVAISTSGRLVWSQAPVQPEPRGSGFIAPVWVPATLLPPAAYELRLSRDGVLAQYYRWRTVR